MNPEEQTDTELEARIRKEPVLAFILLTATDEETGQTILGKQEILYPLDLEIDPILNVTDTGIIDLIWAEPGTLKVLVDVGDRFIHLGYELADVAPCNWVEELRKFYRVEAEMDERVVANYFMKIEPFAEETDDPALYELEQDSSDDREA